MNVKSTEIERKQNFDNKGKFAKGNKIGRMPKKGFTLSDLNKLIRKYEANKDITLLEHYIEQLHKDNKLLARYMDKNIPTKSISELTGPGGEPLSITLREIIYEKDEEEGKKEKPEQART